VSISSLEGRNSSLPRLGIMLALGVALGGGIGFYLGRASAPGFESQADSRADAGAEAGSPAAAPAAVPADPAVHPAKPNQPLDPVGSPTSPVPAPEALPKKLRRIDASISGSLYATLARELEGRDADILSAHVGRLLIWWLNASRDVLKGDRVQVLFETVPGPGQMLIHALRYHSTKQGKTYEAYRFKPAGAKYGRYYDAEGQEVEPRLVQSPIDEYEQVTEVMNLGGRRHRGVDFKADVGMQVRAPFRAKVMRRNWNTRRNGNCLHLVYLDSGITALFLHLDKVLPAAKPGRVVAAGTPVAHSGNTGHSTAPHLHYELRSKSGKLLNPFDVHETVRVKLEGSDLQAYLAIRKKLSKNL
jgi:murein DD-endopeptidase